LRSSRARRDPLAKRIEEGQEPGHRAILSTNLAVERFRELREQLRRHDISVKEVVTSTRKSSPRKRKPTSRAVTAAFAMVDRLLRERDKLLDQARKLRQKASGRGGRQGQRPAWKRFETQASSGRRGCSRSSRAQHRQPDIDREDADLQRRGLVQRCATCSRP